jgi:hypothetical protein
MRLHALARVAALALSALALGTVPGTVARPILFERAVASLPASPDRIAAIHLDVRSQLEHRPLSHARIHVFAMIDGRAYLAASGETDGAGHADLGSLPRAAAWILVDADGYARASTQRILTEPVLSMSLELALAHRLGVTVADDLGQPVADAEIEVSGGDPLPVGAKADAVGRAEVARLAEGPWIVAARAQGFETVVQRGVREGQSPRLVLRKLGALVVRVVGQGGDPAPLAHVQIAGNALWPARTADTVADGTVRIGSLAAGSYALRATSGALVSATDLGIVLGRGEERPVVLTLMPGLFASARVVDGETEDAAPVSHARVTLVEAGLSPFPLEVVSDASGAARLGPVAAGPALLTAQADGFVPRGAVDLPSDGRTATIVLIRAGAVEGRVFDGRGRPVDGATIEVVGSSPNGAPIDDDPRRRNFSRAQFDATLAGPRPLIPSGELGVVPGPVPPIPHASELSLLGASTSLGPTSLEEPWVTRADGTFRAAPASPGRIRVVVRHPEYLEALSDTVTLVPGGAVHVEVVLHEGGSLEGRVVDSAGRPVAGATVTLAALRGSIERMTRSATDGTFAFAAVPDGVVVTASPGDEVDPRVARATTLVPEGGKAALTLTLPEARPPLDVHVRDDRGYAIEAAQVSVGSVDPGVPFRTTVFSDVRGDATVPGARGVAVRLEVTAPGHAGRAVQVAGTDTVANVTLGPAEVLSGTVRERRSGLPVKGAEVTLYCNLGARRTEADASGRFKLTDLAPGAARLRVRAPGRVTHERTIEIADPTSHGTDLGFIELEEEGFVEGTVVDARGSPVAGARVGKDRVPTYLPVGSRSASFAVTDARGRFRLGGLEEGVVTLEAYSPDVGRGRLGSVRVRTGSATSSVTLRLSSDEGGQASEPASAGGVAVTLGDLAGEPPEVVVVAVADGSEAERAGLATGDVLLAVDGARVQSIAEARTRLSGPLGDDVVVLRRRGNVTEAIRIPRERVHR